MKSSDNGPSGERLRGLSAGSGGWKLALLLPLLGGCVSLDVANRKQLADDDPVSRTGVEYRLAFTQVSGKIVWRLADCAGDPKISVKAEGVAVGSAPDMDRRYVIDMGSLSSPAKTSSLKVDRWPNGLLKSINASAEDRTAQIIGSVVSSAAKLFMPVPFGSGEGGPSQCTNEAIAALADVRRLKGEVAAKAREAAAAAASVDALLERIRLAGGTPDSTTANQLANAIQAKLGRQVELAALQAALDKAREPITAETEFAWPGSPNDAGPKLLALPNEAAEAWFLVSNRPRLQRGSCAQLWLVPKRPDGGVDNPDETGLEGLRYREAEPGLFEVRTTPGTAPAAAGAPPCEADKGSALVHSQPIDVLQFGRLMTLRFRNAVFQSNSLEAAWDEQGRLTTVGYGVKTASAETAATMVGSGIETVRTGLSARRGAELGRLNAENAVLEAQAKNAELKAKVNPSQDEEE